MHYVMPGMAQEKRILAGRQFNDKTGGDIRGRTASPQTDEKWAFIMRLKCRIAYSVTGVLVLLMGGCSVVKDPCLWNYVVDINQRGQPVDPTNHPETISITCFDHQLDDIVAGIQAFNPPADKRDPNGRKRIVIFVHGGLNSPADAMERAEETFQQMKNEGIYPIYINWNSDPFSTYGEHLVWVRQGRYTEAGIWSAPFYFFADFIRAFGRAP